MLGRLRRWTAEAGHADVAAAVNLEVRDTGHGERNRVRIDHRLPDPGVSAKWRFRVTTHRQLLPSAHFDPAVRRKGQRGCPRARSTDLRHRARQSGGHRRAELPPRRGPDAATADHRRGNPLRRTGSGRDRTWTWTRAPSPELSTRSGSSAFATRRECRGSCPAAGTCARIRSVRADQGRQRLAAGPIHALHLAVEPVGKGATRLVQEGAFRKRPRSRAPSPSMRSGKTPRAPSAAKPYSPLGAVAHGQAAEGLAFKAWAG